MLYLTFWEQKKKREVRNIEPGRDQAFLDLDELGSFLACHIYRGYDV